MVPNSQFPRCKLLHSSLNQLPPWIPTLFFTFHQGQILQQYVSPPFPVKSKLSCPVKTPPWYGPCEDQTGQATMAASPGFRPELGLLNSLKTHSNTKLFLMLQSFAITPYFVASVELSLRWHIPLWSIRCVKFVFYYKNQSQGQEMCLVQGLAKSKAKCSINNGIHPHLFNFSSKVVLSFNQIYTCNKMWY